MNETSVLLVRKAKLRKAMCQKSSSTVKEKVIKDGGEPEKVSEPSKAMLLEVDA